MSFLPLSIHRDNQALSIIGQFKLRIEYICFSEDVIFFGFNYKLTSRKYCYWGLIVPNAKLDFQFRNWALVQPHPSFKQIQFFN